MTKTSFQQWLNESVTLLADKTEFPQIETQVLLSFITGCRKEWIVSHPESQLDDETLKRLNVLRSRLETGEPLPYLINRQAFYGLDFLVNPAVLIPRPETELLVEECITWLEEHPYKRKIVDIGTGSGIIAITLADHFQDLQVTAIDISGEALEVAKTNADTLQVEGQITFVQNDLLENIDECFDLIAANLPYIPTDTLNQLPVVNFEPRLALDGGADGLDLIKRLLGQAKERIRPGGLIILEIESGQSLACEELCSIFFSNAKIDTLTDLAKHPRITKIQL